MNDKASKNVLWFKDVSIKDVALVGGKNASLGEMFSRLTEKGVRVPDGFALSADFYWRFLAENNLEKKLRAVFAEFRPESLASLQKTGRLCRELLGQSSMPAVLEKEILRFYADLSARYGQKEVDVAVRTSGVAEDSPTTSFAGQFETYLNVQGKKELLTAVRQSLASVFTDRAIAYRLQNKIPQLQFALSIGVQKMVRSDKASSGIIFTLDTETGFRQVVLINSIWGVGEMIVKGKITPDEFQVFKPTQAIIIKNLGQKTRKYVYDRRGGLKEVSVPPKDRQRLSLRDNEVLTLARWAGLIEEHYGQPLDIEWAKDGVSGELFVVQSRPETVHSRQSPTSFREYRITGSPQTILQGIAVGEKIGAGKVRVVTGPREFSRFEPGEILVTRMTDPDWVPLMRLASGIVTDEGGRTSHAAIVSRELGLPAVLGTQKATRVLKNGQFVTLDCTAEQGRVLENKVPWRVKEYDLKKLPETATKVMVNLGAPEVAYKSSFLPVAGCGLTRLEFIIADKIKIHPLALCHFAKIPFGLRRQINELTVGYRDKKKYFTDELAEGVAQIAAAFWPRPVIVRLSDFKSNEYSRLVGGEIFEPKEENPMLGLRGASRYNDEEFQPAFELECRAIKKVRGIFGLKNVWLMIPFCRTPAEGRKVLDLLAKNGLPRGQDGLRVLAMAEIPSNAILASEFLEIFDGFSIGSNDLTQLVLGLDRDNSRLAQAQIGDERNEAVKTLMAQIIRAARTKGKYVGICGEAPANFPELVEFLIKEGIESISVNPESVIKTILLVSKFEKQKNV